MVTAATEETQMRCIFVFVRLFENCQDKLYRKVNNLSIVKLSKRKICLSVRFNSKHRIIYTKTAGLDGLELPVFSPRLKVKKKKYANQKKSVAIEIVKHSTIMIVILL